MASLSNKNRNTAIPTNKEYSTKAKTWGQMDKTWADYPSTWNNPQDFKNKASSNEATVINKNADS